MPVPSRFAFVVFAGAAVAMFVSSGPGAGAVSGSDVIETVMPWAPDISFDEYNYGADHSFGLAFLPDGSVLVTDIDDHVVRKIAIDGDLTNEVGTFEVEGDSLGIEYRTQVNLSSPEDVAVAPDGRLFVADTGNNKIRMVDADGFVTTIAGTGTAGFSGDGGPAVDATLRAPSSLVFDPSDGSVYFSDRLNNRVRRIASDGTISTVAGTGTAGSGTNQLNGPRGLALGPSNDLYIADAGNREVQRVDLESPGFVTVAGNGSAGYSGDGGPAVGASLGSPVDVAVDTSGNIFIADHDNAVIRRVAAGSGLISTVVGSAGGPGSPSGDGGPATSARLNRPEGVLWMPMTDALYIADTDSVRAVNLDHVAPTVTVPGRTNNEALAYGSVQTLEYSCGDDVAIYLCVGSFGGPFVPSGSAIPTDRIGSVNLVIVALDYGGNRVEHRMTFYVGLACERRLTGKYANSSGISAAVGRLYMATFLRQADDDGHAYWLMQSNRGLSLLSTAALFADSQEFRNNYAGLNDLGFVTLMYDNVMCRPFDAAGRDYWLGLLQSGRLSRGDVLLYFSQSQEFKNRTETS